jgi:hypothetical protein
MQPASGDRKRPGQGLVQPLLDDPLDPTGAQVLAEFPCEPMALA